MAEVILSRFLDVDWPLFRVELHLFYPSMRMLFLLRNNANGPGNIFRVSPLKNLKPGPLGKDCNANAPISAEDVTTFFSISETFSGWQGSASPFANWLNV